jgi:hypothetical protein
MQAWQQVDEHKTRLAIATENSNPRLAGATLQSYEAPWPVSQCDESINPIACPDCAARSGLTVRIDLFRTVVVTLDPSNAGRTTGRGSPEFRAK